jgi:lipopolysaccharide export system protein LptC
LEKSDCSKILARWSSYNILLSIAVMVHGWLFRVETGYIEELSLEDSIP